MSEHTPLTEAEREALDEEFGDAFTVAWADAIERFLAARTSTATADTACEWCNKVDAHGRHENGCRLGLGPDELEFIPLTTAGKPQPEADLVEAKLVGTWRCPDCEGEFPASVVTLSAATADTGLRERVEALLSTWRADDEESLNTFGQHLMGGAVLSCAEHLQAVLDATAAPTTDTGARYPRDTDSPALDWIDGARDE